MTTPKIRIFDIETTPNIHACWRPGLQYVSVDSIIQERVVICAAWKDVGENYVYHTPVLKFDKNGVPDDTEVILSIREGLEDADILVAHNGDKFDLPWIVGRSLVHGFGPLPNIPIVDTWKIARRKFNLNSTKLDYLAKLLGFEGKMKTEYEWWLAVLRQDKNIIQKMLEYNIDDVCLLEEVYLALRPFMTNHPNLGVIMGQIDTCPNCGTKGSLVKNGTRPRGRVSVAQEYRCKACGTYPSGPAVRAKDVDGNRIETR
jgi:predicted PolB exonuclease-like 3'-5' exonuclease